MTETTPTPDRPAESILGPITPIRCTEPGCHWACHGVPDKYADSRARIVREHLAAEHAPTTEFPDRPTDQLRAAAQRALESLDSLIADHQDPGAEALGARYELARELSNTSPEVARQLLGTSTGEDAADAPLPMVWTVWVEDESTLGHCADEVTAKLAAIEHHQESGTPGLGVVYGWNERGGHLELLADGEDTGIRVKDSKVHGAPPAPADRATVPAAVYAAIRRLAAHAVGFQDVLDESDRGPWGKTIGADIAELRRLAGEAAAGAHQTEQADTDEQQAAVAQAIRDFQFDNYGLDDVDPNSEYAEWVGDLASSIVGALPAVPAAPEGTR